MIEVGVATMGWPFFEVARWAGEHGVRRLEVMIGPVFDKPGSVDTLNLDDLLGNGPARVRETLAQYNLGISALAPMLNLLDPDPAKRAERAAVLRKTIEACVLLGVDTVVIYGGSCSGMFLYGLPAVGPGHPSNTVDANLRLFSDVLPPLLAYAGDRGVRIAMETAPRGGGHGNIAHCPGLWERIFDAVPSEALGLSFDPSHLVWLQVGPVTGVIKRYGSRIFHVDGKDTEILRDRLAKQGILGNDWWRYRLPGYGELHWESIIAALRAVSYRGAVDIENEDPLYPGLPGCAMASQYLSTLLGDASIGRAAAGESTP